MLPVQIHLRHFHLGSLIHLFIVAMFFSSLTLGYVAVCMGYFYRQLLYLWQCLATIQQPTCKGLPLHCQLSRQSHRTFDRNKALKFLGYKT